MTTMPVMLDHGLAGHSGGGKGGSSSNGISYFYGARFEKMGKDFVTVLVHLKVERHGEAEFHFDEKLQIDREGITEVRPEARIRIRAYFEPTEKP